MIFSENYCEANTNVLPSNVALAKILMWRGLFDQQIHLCCYIKIFMTGEVTTYKMYRNGLTLSLIQTLLRIIHTPASQHLKGSANFIDCIESY